MTSHTHVSSTNYVLASIHLVLLIILSKFPSPLSSFDFFSACRNDFSCGTGKINKVGFPFWGEGRPEGCGHPKLRLNCNLEEVSTINISNIEYRVLDIDHEHRILKIARNEIYLKDFCLSNLQSTTLDFDVFEDVPGYKNLTLFYGCPSPASIGPSFFGHFNCFSKDGYMQWGAQAPGFCEASVVVRVPTSPLERLNLSGAKEALRSGFEVKWKVGVEECKECVGSNGVCGYDWISNNAVCYCEGETLGPKTCPPKSNDKATPGKKGSRVSLSIGLAIAGAAIVGMLLVFGFFHVQRKRKRLAQQSNSKDLSTPPSSKGIVTSTTNLSQSVPSYFSSKSNLGNGGSTYFGVQVFSYTELEEATDNFDTSRELGDGGFGTVYYGILKDGREVAVKRLYESNFKRVEQFMNEIEILTRLRHSNLVTLYGCTSRHSRELLLVYEYIPNGTVADHLHGKQAKSGLLTWPLRLSIATKTAEALAYLHASDIIHRDVKTNNILLDNYFHVKVADFGLSRLFPNHVTHISTAPQGTPGYVDPEYYQCYQLTDKSDVYSFGVVLIELISSLEAVDTSRHRQDINLANMAINKIQNHELHELVDPCLGFEKDYSIRQMTTSVAELAFRCLQQERDMRPSMDEVLEVLRGIENEGFVAQAAEVVDIKADDVVLLKSIPPPLSPDSVVDVKWQMDVLRRTA